MILSRSWEKWRDFPVDSALQTSWRFWRIHQEELEYWEKRIWWRKSIREQQEISLTRWFDCWFLVSEWWFREVIFRLSIWFWIVLGLVSIRSISREMSIREFLISGEPTSLILRWEFQPYLKWSKVRFPQSKNSHQVQKFPETEKKIHPRLSRVWLWSDFWFFRQDITCVWEFSWRSYWGITDGALGTNVGDFLFPGGAVSHLNEVDYRDFGGWEFSGVVWFGWKKIFSSLKGLSDSQSSTWSSGWDMFGSEDESNYFHLWGRMDLRSLYSDKSLRSTFDR